MPNDANSAGSLFKPISITANRSGIRGGTTTIGANELKSTNETLAHLIEDAYQVNPDQISAAPEWVNQERYDLVASLADSSGGGHVLQAVLSDRFKLAVHRETKLVPVYVLMVAADGPKLSESVPATEDSGLRVINVEAGRVAGREVPIATLAGIVSDLLHQPVLDETDLHHHYDVNLEWRADSESSVAALSKALEEQLGLKLVLQARAKEFLVIDHVEVPSTTATPN